MTSRPLIMSSTKLCAGRPATRPQWRFVAAVSFSCSRLLTAGLLSLLLICSFFRSMRRKVSASIASAQGGVQSTGELIAPSHTAWHGASGRRIVGFSFVAPVRRRLESCAEYWPGDRKPPCRLLMGCRGGMPWPTVHAQLRRNDCTHCVAARTKHDAPECAAGDRATWCQPSAWSALAICYLRIAVAGRRSATMRFSSSDARCQSARYTCYCFSPLVATLRPSCASVHVYVIFKCMCCVHRPPSSKAIGMHGLPPGHTIPHFPVPWAACMLQRCTRLWARLRPQSRTNWSNQSRTSCC